jgi:subtilisin family serine protease
MQPGTPPISLASETTVIVADTWASVTPHPDLSALRFDPRAAGSGGVAPDGTAFGNHGFWVAGLLGADVNGTGTSGTAFRAADSLDLLGVQVGGLSFPEIIHTLESAAPPTGNLVINTSFGYNDPGETNETRAARALYALQWRGALQRIGPDRVLVVAAAGNDGLADPTPDATLSSPMTTQALVSDLSTLIAADEQALWSRVEAQATDLPNAKLVVGSTIVVGAANEFGNRLGFSTPGEDIRMPGFELTGPCVVDGGRCAGGEMTDNGTSGATPLASGVVAMIWSLAPALPAAEVRVLALAASSNGAIDAYNAMWAALGATASSPLPTLVDADDDGAFDASDIALLLGAWAEAEALDPDPSVAPRDWSRFDLNGDGYSRTDTAVVLDLDVDGTARRGVLVARYRRCYCFVRRKRRH